MMRELGGVFGIAVAVAVFAGAGSYASPDAFLDGFTPAVAVAAGLSAARSGRRPGPAGPTPTAGSRAVGPVPAFEGAGGADHAVMSRR